MSLSLVPCWVYKKMLRRILSTTFENVELSPAENAAVLHFSA